jgi:hypothetical protein
VFDILLAHASMPQVISWMVSPTFYKFEAKDDAFVSTCLICNPLSPLCPFHSRMVGHGRSTIESFCSVRWCPNTLCRKVRIFHATAKWLGLQASASGWKRFQRVLSRMFLERIAAIDSYDEAGSAKSGKVATTCRRRTEFLQNRQAL